MDLQVYGENSMSVARISAICVAFLLLGCTPSEKLLRHYAKAEPCSGNGCSTLIEFSAFAVPPTRPPELPFVLSLSPQAQSELVKILGTGSAEQGGYHGLLSALATSAARAVDECAWANRTRFQRNLVLTLLGRFDQPADRIDQLRFTAILQEGQAQFVSWDRFESSWISANFGTADLTRISKVTLDSSETNTRNLADSGGTDVNLFKLGGEYSSNLKESVTLTARRLSVGGFLTPQKAILVQDGAPLYSLFGTVSATITFDVQKTEYAESVSRLVLRNDTGGFRAPRDVQLTRCLLIVPKSSQELTATVMASGNVRQVTRRAETISEADDTVKFTPLPSDLSTSVTLATSDELAAATYCVGTGGKDCSSGERIHILTPEGNDPWEVLKFASIPEAQDFKGWLTSAARHESVTTLGWRELRLASGNETGTEGKPVNADVAARLQIQRSWRNVSDAPD